MNVEKLQKVRSVLQAGDTGRAEKLLEGIEERDAEWFYLRALIYRKKTWFSESRKCIKTAIKLDPKNEEYKSFLNELEQLAKESRKKMRAEQKQKEKNSQKMREAENSDVTLCQAVCEGICYFAD